MLFKNFPRLSLTVIRNMSVGKEKVVNIGGVKINYLDAGKGKKSVLCLPGALGTIWSDFKPQIEELSDNMRLVVWDPPGYGKSRPPTRDFSGRFFNRDAEYASKLMEYLEIPKYSLLGWSDGGITALIMAGMYPMKIDKVIVWGANAYVTENDVKIFENIKDISKWSEKMKKPLEEVYGQEGLSNLMHQWYESLKYYFDKKKGDICQNDLNKIKAEVFVIHGEKDPLVPKEHPDYLIKSIKKNKFYSFPEGKHNLHLKYSKEFNQIVSEFILS